MADPVLLHAFVYGRVQGTYFRTYVSRKAAELGLTGFVRNLPDGAVEVEAEGPRIWLDKLVGYLNIGSPASRVEKVITRWAEYTGKHTDFKIKY